MSGVYSGQLRPEVTTPNFSRLSPEERLPAQEYDAFLQELTFNSLPVIKNLTKIAGENVAARRSIVFAIESRIGLAEINKKLPLLYLVDSIVKNVGGEYIQAFRLNIFKVFTSMYEIADYETCARLRKLLNTWSDIFGQELCDLMWRRVHERDQRNADNSSSSKTQSLKIPKKEHSSSQYPETNKRPRYDSGSAGQPQNISMDNLSTIEAQALVQLDIQVQRLTNEIVSKAVAGQPPSLDVLQALSALLAVKLQHVKNPEELKNVLDLQAQITQNIQQQQQAAQNPSGPSSNAISDAQNALAVPQIASVVAPTNSAPAWQGSAVQPTNPAHSAKTDRASTQVRTTARVTRTNVCGSFDKIRKFPHRGTVALLYDELPHKSAADGNRFAKVEDLRAHLDWLFEKNKKKTSKQHGGISRNWFISVAEWLEGRSQTSASKANTVEAIFRDVNQQADKDVGGLDITPSGDKVGVARADGDNEICPICGEKFETFWDEDEQTWKWQDALRTADGKVYHVFCMSSPVLEGLTAAGSQATDRG
uniref:CID domain-containing protein n=1 Tax=Rhodosorus marinus TaxID=101924 RepID=A0A7S0BKE9_9RHOD|mmetsp:Transcript_20465/g.29703  ORF Transcript_20465/g.29703 Transcript_20465/m.29703 type:complete len:536 (+) Transcript_20465:60-1667(+)